MAPKKRKPSTAENRRLMQKYHIQFEGPLPPKAWPLNYKHLFSVVRQIWATRYDEYVQERLEEDGERETLRLNRKRVKELRDAAYKLRKEDKTTESTWRAYVEHIVRKRFSTSVLWSVTRKQASDHLLIRGSDRCKKEIWKSDYEAEPLGVDARQRLRRKREGRMQCQCHRNPDAMEEELENSDEEDKGDIFQFVTDKVISQDPEVVKENFTISMKPDSIIGLTLTERSKRYIESHPLDITPFPVDGSQLLYPFMLFEAKREEEAQGFRHIEAQSAFALYRLLKVQENLRKCSKQSELEPLVWFFGSHGDEWRLYAGIVQEEKVRFFDLWLGTIESHDGALQLIQILDFIWSWARDIYRPSIRKCLDGDRDILRSLSPASSNAFSRAQSTFSSLSLSGDVGSMITYREEPRVNDLYHAPTQRKATIEDANSHPLWNWIENRDTTTAWASQTRVQHSNIACCSFRLLDLPVTKQSFGAMMRCLEHEERGQTLTQLGLLIQQPQYSFPLTITHLRAIEQEWIGSNTTTSGIAWQNSIPIRRAFFFFRSFISHESWQIQRELYCILWSLDAAKVLSELAGSSRPVDPGEYSYSLNMLRMVQQTLIKETLQARDLFGNMSVEYALCEHDLVLSRETGPARGQPGHSAPPHWTLPQSGVLKTALTGYRGLFKATSSGTGLFFNPQWRSDRLVWIRRQLDNREETHTLPSLSTREAEVGAMLVVKRDFWTPECPKFCLFVLGDYEVSGAELGHLLRCAIKKEMWDVGATYSDADRHVLQSWVRALQVE